MECFFVLFLLGCGFPLIPFIQGWTYHFSQDTMSYDNAQGYCRQKYTDMVAIQNQEENRYLNENLPFSPSYYWIGIRKNRETGRWTWVGTNKALTDEAENWAKNEPNNKNGNENEDCVEMYVKRAIDTGKWNDEPCSKRKRALCFKASCHSSSCNNHGECKETINDYNCNCSDGFFGKDCEHVMTCPEIVEIDQGSVECSHVYGNFTYQSNCHFTCSDGHLLVGPEKLQCNENGDWGFPIPQCKVIQCQRPELPDNGAMNCSDDGEILAENSTCNFYCKAGFTLVGSSSVLCTTPGEWSEKSPNCEAVQCKNPGIPKYGAMACSSQGEMQSYNATCDFICTEGFSLAGESSIQCMTPGQWSAIPPKCEAIQCERPEQPENGTMKCFSDEKMLPFNSTCQFTCDEGFTIVGSYSTQCLTTGQWIESPPKCKATLCRRPEIPLNGAVSCTHSGETLPEKSTCNFMCAEGYKLIGPSSVACAGADQWTGGIPICEYMQCDSLTAPVNGLIRCKNGFSYNSTCEFSCVEGYEMIGSSELQCLSSRQWTSSVPFCKAIQCPYMPSLKNGRMVCQDGTKYESQCSFSCLKGFRLNGSPVLTCQSSGAWTSSVPTCEALQCPSLTAPEDGYMVCQNATKYKSQCSFTCLKGFKLIGSPTLSCQSSGEWTSSIPTCEAVQCNVIVAPSMGKMNCSRLDFGYGTVCKFTCEYDLSLNGTDTLECYSDGSWNTETPTCDTMKTPYDAATYLTVGITSGASVLSTASLILWLIKRMRKTAKKFTPTNSYQDLEAPGIYQNTENVDDV